MQAAHAPRMRGPNKTRRVAEWFRAGCATAAGGWAAMPVRVAPGGEGLPMRGGIE